MRSKFVMPVFAALAALVVLLAGSPAQAAPSATTPALEREIAGLVHSGATRIAPTQVAWNHGTVVLDLAPSRVVQPAATVHGCPSGWFCFYDAANYGGRRLQYQGCYTQGFPDSFFMKTTSWVHNKSSGIVQPYDALGDVRWNEYPNSSSSNVGSFDNDIALGFYCHT
jgi:hypothetical protein